MEQILGTLKLLLELSFPHLAIVLALAVVGLSALCVWVVFSMAKRNSEKD